MTFITSWRNPLSRYVRWLHTQWPAGTVEKLPQVHADGSTNVRGLYVVGDLTGIPLLKFSADSGARAVQVIAEDLKRRDASGSTAFDLLIVGGGVAGMAAALEARRAGLRFEVLEAAEPFSTLVNFPAGKPIYTYPTGMTPTGELQFRAQVHPKEVLVEDVRRLTGDITPRIARAQRVVRRHERLDVELADGSSATARRVIVAIGRSGNFRKLGVPGEDLSKVYNRLHDPKDFADKDVLVVGGGDSALETAIAIAECGGRVTISYRKLQFSRPKPDNLAKLEALIADPMADVQVEKPTSERRTTAVGEYMGAYRIPGAITLMMASHVNAINEDHVELIDGGHPVVVPNDAVFSMIGREAPLEFFRRSGVGVHGD